MTLDSQKPIKKLGNRERARFWMTRAFSPISLSLSLSLPFFFFAFMAQGVFFQLMSFICAALWRVSLAHNAFRSTSKRRKKKGKKEQLTRDYWRSLAGVSVNSGRVFSSFFARDRCVFRPCIRVSSTISRFPVSPAYNYDPARSYGTPWR